MDSLVELFGLANQNELYDIAAYGLSGFFLILGGYFLKPSGKVETKEAPKLKEKKKSETKQEQKPKQKEQKKPEEPKGPTWTERLAKGLSKTRKDVWGKVHDLLSKPQITEEEYEQIEEILYTSDMSISMIEELLDSLREFSRGQEEGVNYLEKIREFLEGKMKDHQARVNQSLLEFNKDGHKEMLVVMIVGVNGAGKTTTIGKLATKLKSQGANVVVGACDTFRAAAVEQLETWCNRAGVEMVKAKEGANPTGVAYDTVQKAKDMGADYCLIDTAGRLHTKSNLMDELKKTKSVMAKVVDTAPHETILVIDAITGQNALNQAKEFNKALDLSGLIFTKCDGSSKAGSAVGIVNELQVPITYIGVGEGVDDINPFDLSDYLKNLVGA